ncbi:E3 ubiquitin-protein ligase RNFT2 [Parasteatoda tepidariorum]|nr:RING finger and transmembrane domain-containing protein 2 [Parasteatoda tepidariorum]
MAENNRPTRPNRNHLPWSIQQIHENSHQIASSATQHIHELQDLVMQGLSPLINTASGANHLQSRRIADPHSLWFESPEDINLTTPRNSNMNSGNNIENFVIDMESVAADSFNPVHNPAANDNLPNLETNDNTRSSDNDQGVSALRNSPELQAIIAFAEKYMPFVLILLLKLIFDHRIGILVNLGLFITFCHANTVVKREVSRQGKRRLRNLCFVLVNLTTSILVIYTLLADRSLAYALIFVPPYSVPIDLWDVLWIVSVTDFVLRLITICVKIVFVSIPTKILACQKKGKYYLFTERSSQLYRTIIPVQHWLYFFSESYSGPSKVFGVILSATYLIFKFKGFIKKFKLWRETLMKVLQSKTYGVTPSTNQIKEAGDACPICQDDYKSPSMLQCKHIFCEECVALWFDRERTCPICRAQIADDPTWRDGSTTLLHQIF